MSIEQKASALDSLLRGNSIDQSQLSAYLEPNEIAKIRSAGSYAGEIVDRLKTGSAMVGTPLPWPALIGKVLFRPHELSIWTGYKGHAKTMVLSQCMCSAMAHGERVLVISPEFRPPTIIERKLRQCCASKDFGVPYVEAWSRWAADKLWFYDHQGSVNRRYVLAAIRYATEVFKVKHVVVDSLMKMGMRVSAEGYDDQKLFVDQLQSICHNYGPHIHLVAHARKGSSGDDHPPGLHDIKGVSEIADMAENIFVVWTHKKKLDAASIGDHSKASEPDVIFRCEAQRNGEWRGSLALNMVPYAFQFSEKPDDPRVYFAETHVEF